MHALLKTTSEAPIPVERKLSLAEQANPVLSNECRRRLRYMHIQSFDWEQGGLLSPIKFIDRDSVEYSLMLSAEQDQNEARMAQLTLDNALDLLDPIWGGVYQYSTQGKWDVPHYRKTMAAQAGHLRLYSLAYAQTKYKRYLDVTNSIQHYIKSFMTADCGAFYTGQSDKTAGINPMLYFSLSDAERKEIGIPDIDKRIQTRENGWMIEALTTHYEFCGNDESLEMAKFATDEINLRCRLSTGAYLSNTMTKMPHHLADTLAMARALLQLYRCTFEKHYLDKACQSADYIDQYYRHDICGYNSRVTGKHDAPSPRQMDENIALTRFYNLLAHYSKFTRYTKMAKHGLRYLCIPEVATARMEEAGILLIDHETRTPPLTINLYGNKSTPLFRKLLSVAQRHPRWYKLMRCYPSRLTYASIEIDGFKSKPVTTTERLKQLLQSH